MKIINGVEQDSGTFSGDVKVGGVLTAINQGWYGIKWPGATSACVRTGALTSAAASASPGNDLLPIQSAMRRCILDDDGRVVYYLDPDDSYNRLGFTPSIIGTDDAGAADKVSDAVDITGTDDVGTAYKVSDVGEFTGAESAYVGKYVHNTTDDTYSLITAKDGDDVLSIREDIMDIAEGFVIGPLSAPASVYVGKYVKNTTDDTYALITAKDSDAALSIDDDIMDITETFEICTAGLGDGGDGQVMVQIPAFWYRFSVDEDGYPNWDISTVPFEGASIHPAFYKNGEFVSYRYVSAFEGSMYDVSALGMVAPADIITEMYAHGDKMCSLAGEFPKSNETRAEYRSMAAQRGTGWRQYEYDLHSAIQLLYLVEYADFDSRSMIGAGRTELSGGTWVADSYIGKCGKSLGDGNATASVGGNTNDAYMTFRGLENWYGNCWKWMDGINVKDGHVYVSNDDSDFQDDTALKYTALDITLPTSNNYQQTLFLQGRGFLPETVGALETKITDYYWCGVGWTVVRYCSGATYSVNVGIFCIRADVPSTGDYESSISRIAY